MLGEKYKPACFEEVAGQTEALAVLAHLRNNGGLGGHAFWLSADSGQGKTAIADLIALEVAGEPWAVAVFDDPSQLTSEALDEIRRHQTYRPLGKGLAYIVNEAHGLRRDQVRKLLGLTDTGRIKPWVVWCFTTTRKGQQALFEGVDDAAPMMSRCVILPMRPASDLDLDFALRARKIAQTEGLDGKPLDCYLSLARSLKCNLRAMLSAIEAGAMRA